MDILSQKCVVGGHIADSDLKSNHKNSLYIAFPNLSFRCETPEQANMTRCESQRTQFAGLGIQPLETGYLATTTNPNPKAYVLNFKAYSPES